MTSNAGELEGLFTDATSWLLNSGIQNLDPSSKAFGSFNSWFDEKSKSFSYAFSEITGYGISTLLYLNSTRSDHRLLNRARLAADWLLSVAWDSKHGGFQCRYDHSKGKFNDRVCSFDAGMCLTGLANLYRETKEKKYLKGAIKAGRWLVQRMQKENGSFYTRIDTRTGTLIDDPSKWSSQSGTYHAKISIGLLNLFNLIKDSIYKENAAKVCEWSLKLQTPSGRFITNRLSGNTHLHPHCYSAEGLLYAGIILRNERYIESATSALRWITSHLLSTGGVPRMYRRGHFSPRESVDILSQTIRLWLLLLRIHKMADEDAKLEKAVNRLHHFRSASNDRRSRGGFLYGYNDEGCFVRHVNSWGTMFAIQALSMYSANDSYIFDVFYFI